MAKLTGRQRADLPDKAFAYIDSHGRRRLPINDERHVRNALARFSQVSFEDDAARERARKRLLNAAKKYGIVPVGFITGQLESERTQAVAEIRARSADVTTLPTGFVTFLFTDIEGSTVLLRQLGDGYVGVLNDVRDIVRDAVVQAGGREVEARADEFFAVFEQTPAAIEAAVSIQRAMKARTWPDDLQVRIRVGIHSGRPTLTDTGYVGLDVHTAARVCTAGHGGQVVVSADTRAALEASSLEGVSLRTLGRHGLAGLGQPEELFQVEAEGLESDFPPLRAEGVASAQPPR